MRDYWPIKASKGEKELTVVYTFPFHYPREILHNFSAQIHEWVDERLDWKDFIYAATDNDKLVIQHAKDDNGSGTVTMIVRGPEFPEVHELMRELVETFNITLLRYPGLYWKLSIPMSGSGIKVMSPPSAASRRASRLSRSSIRNGV